MRFLSSLLSSAAAVALLSGCFIEAEKSCTAIAIAAVQVTVVDADAKPVRDAKVTYTVDGGAPQDAECTLAGSTPAECDRWVAGWEQPGTYVVKAESADGTRSTQKTVVVGEDECHVKGQDAQLTL